MATESELRDLLRGPDPEGRGEIDLDAVLSRTRRRRRPRVFAAQALGSLALVGVLGTAVFVAGPLANQGATMSAQDSGAGADGFEEAATAPLAEDALRWMPDACGTPVTEQSSTHGVALELSLETITDSQKRIPVTVTLRNDGPDRLVGTSSVSPHVSVARDGLVVWHSYSTQDAIARAVDLAPGDSMTFEASFDRVICESEDDLITDDPQHELAAAPPGRYELRAVLVVATDAGATLVAASPPLSLEIAE